jgi:hypothetical protein
VYTIKKNTGAAVVASKEAGVEVSAEKTMYVFVSPDQNVGQYHNVNTGNKSFDRMEQFK